MGASKLHPDQALRGLVAAIVAADSATVTRLLKAAPELATARFEGGATRQSSRDTFIDAVRRYIVAGDSALHFAAAAHSPEVARLLLAAGADVRTRNRFGDEPLHAAAVGHPGDPGWNPDAQAATISFLVESGADPNAANKRGVAPLHIAVRTRSAAAVRRLIELGAEPTRPNGNGSTPLLLAQQNTGRSGSGSPEAKAEQQQILNILAGNH